MLSPTTQSKTSTWERFKQHSHYTDALELTIDISRINFSESFFQDMAPKMEKAFKDMEALEKGAIANPDEKRMVGHYWLRNASLAPDHATRDTIKSTIESIQGFSAQVHAGIVRGENGEFRNLICVGIGGSALGPQFVSEALGNPHKDKMNIYFIDNTDPQGIDTLLKKLEGQLGHTLVNVISKSGGTPEPRNGMLELEAAYAEAGLEFAKHAIATTSEGSKLFNHATNQSWIKIFPMWDWVGGRTSELAAVGLLPAALQGIDIDQMLLGAHVMDEATRQWKMEENPAAMLALAWYQATDGKGSKDMVILPYKDNLLLLSRYLQQLVMESLGKEHDLEGNTVNQGIAVYGNKGSTDQHAYIQQLRDGVPNFFATFIEVLKDRNGKSIEVEPGITSGDYLQGFFLGTREALYENGRESITITVPNSSAKIVGALIALYERAVGFYASLVNINAYHQPGVEAGKKAAASTLELRSKIHEQLKSTAGKAYTAEELAQAIEETDKTEQVYKILEHLAANPQKNVRKEPEHPFYMSKFLC